MEPLGGFARPPRGLAAVLFVLALAPALVISWTIYSDLLHGTRYLGSDPIKEAEHLFGSWTLRLLIATLLITPLRRLTGWNWLVRHRRTLGLFTFTYAALHLLTWAFLDVQLIIDDLVGWDTIVTDLTKRPFIMIGMLCFLLLVPLALTSTKGMIRRLGARWGKLHRLIYLVAVLGVIHFWMAVKLDIREPAIYGLIIAVLLGWRWRERGKRAKQAKEAA